MKENRKGANVRKNLFQTKLIFKKSCLLFKISQYEDKEMWFDSTVWLFMRQLFSKEQRTKMTYTGHCTYTVHASHIYDHA